MLATSYASAVLSVVLIVAAALALVIGTVVRLLGYGSFTRKRSRRLRRLG